MAAAADKAMNSGGAELRLERITKSYGRTYAVRNLDLVVEPGEFVTLLGSSGSGKTTTLMMLGGFVAPTSGKILIGGRDVTLLPPGRRNLGVVFQNYALFPHLTVAQNLAFPLQMRRMPGGRIAREVKRALELVELADKGERYPRELSGGQQQRVALARAIIFSPQALLMDEPLGALDKSLREHMQLEIKRLHKSTGTTIVFVTHDQDEALMLSDRVAVMRDGIIEQIAPAQDIYRHPSTPWVAGFVGQSNFLEGEIEARDGNMFAVTLRGGARVRAHGEAGLAAGQRVLGVLRPESVRVGNAATPGDGVEGTVIEHVYLGHTTKLSIQLADGARVDTLATNSGSPCAAPGDRVALSWSPEALWLVPATGERA